MAIRAHGSSARSSEAWTIGVEFGFVGWHAYERGGVGCGMVVALGDVSGGIRVLWSQGGLLCGGEEG